MNGVLRFYSTWNSTKGLYDIYDRQTMTKIDEIRGFSDADTRVDNLNKEDRKDMEPVIELPTTYSGTKHRDKIEVETMKIYNE